MPLSFPQLLAPIAQADQGGGLREMVDSLARTPLSRIVIFVAVLTLVRVAIFPILSKTPIYKRTGIYPFLKFVNEIADAFVYAGVFVFLVIRPFVLQAFLIPSGSMWPALYVNDFIVANKAIYRYSDPKINDVVVFRPPPEAILDPKQIDPDGQVNVDFIKRCIGRPGDLIELKKGTLYRNGRKIDEPYVHYSDTTDRGQTFTDKSQDGVTKMSMANFKWIRWNDRIIPLSYTDQDANSLSPAGPLGAEPPYETLPKFAIESPADQRKAMAAPAEKIPPGFYMMLGDNRNHSMDSRVWGLVPRDEIVGRSEFIWLPIGRWRITR